MNNKKKQTVVVAMATALGVSVMMSPVAVYAQEEDSAIIMQENNQQKIQQETNPQDETTISKQEVPVNENLQDTNTNNLQSVTDVPVVGPRSNEAFTNDGDAQQAIQEALGNYPVSNETTIDEIDDFLEKTFINTGKLADCSLGSFDKTKATVDTVGNITLQIVFVLRFQSSYIYYYYMNITIPRLPTAGEVAINDKNFPDAEFRSYIKKTFDSDSDDVLSIVELDNAKRVYLYGNKNIKSIEGIQYLRNLVFLNCGNTDIETFDVSKNKKLETLYCTDNLKLTSLNIDGAESLEELQCYSTGITELNVKNNTNLDWLACYKTNINSLDVSNNSKLRILDCFSNPQLTTLKTNKSGLLEKLDITETGINELDVSDHSKLTDLKAMRCPNLVSLNISNASLLKELWTKDSPVLAVIQTGNNTALEIIVVSGNTSLSDMDVSSMSNLKNFTGDDTALRGLDLTNNKNLDSLSISGCPLAYLNLPQEVDINYLYSGNNKQVSFDISGSSFKITDIFPNINVANLSLLSGATQNGEVFSGYKNGEPIRYTYYCGMYNGRKIQLSVSLIPNIQKLDNSITIKKDLGKPYDGIPVELNKSDIVVKGGNQAYKIRWEMLDGSYWKDVNGPPCDVGNYRVRITVEEDEYFYGASNKVEFAITKATNSWKNELMIADWTYSEKSNLPTATAQFGNPTFTYSDSKTGTFTSNVPTDAGTWYVKATVAGTDNYTGLEEIVMFQIQKANNKWISQPELIGWTYGEKANMPTATSKYGNVTYSYSDTKVGIYTDKVPQNAGTWYIKASVEETGNYTGLEYITTFMIAPKHINDDIIPDIHSDEDIAHLIIKDGDNELVKGKDYRIDKQQKDNEVTITITFQGNYIGTATRSYMIDTEKSEEIIKDTNSVSTGDHSQTGFFATICIFFAGCFVYLTGKKKE